MEWKGTSLKRILNSNHLGWGIQKSDTLSVKTVNDIETESIQDLFGSIIYLRGEEYFYMYIYITEQLSCYCLGESNK